MESGLRWWQKATRAEDFELASKQAASVGSTSWTRAVVPLVWFYCLCRWNIMENSSAACETASWGAISISTTRVQQFATAGRRTLTTRGKRIDVRRTVSRLRGTVSICGQGAFWPPTSSVRNACGGPIEFTPNSSHSRESFQQAASKADAYLCPITSYAIRETRNPAMEAALHHETKPLIAFATR